MKTVFPNCENIVFTKGFQLLYCRGSNFRITKFQFFFDQLKIDLQDQQGKPHLHHIPESTANIHELFERLDEAYFEGELKKNGVSLEWSQKMQSGSAGYCYELEDKYKGSKRCYIVLNKPLLNLRPRSGVIDYLLVKLFY